MRLSSRPSLHTPRLTVRGAARLTLRRGRVAGARAAAAVISAPPTPLAVNRRVACVRAERHRPEQPAHPARPPHSRRRGRSRPRPRGEGRCLPAARRVSFSQTQFFVRRGASPSGYEASAGRCSTSGGRGWAAKASSSATRAVRSCEQRLFTAVAAAQASSSATRARLRFASPFDSTRRPPHGRGRRRGSQRRPAAWRTRRRLREGRRRRRLAARGRLLRSSAWTRP